MISRYSRQRKLQMRGRKKIRKTNADRKIRKNAASPTPTLCRRLAAIAVPICIDVIERSTHRGGGTKETSVRYGFTDGNENKNLLVYFKKSYPGVDVC